MLAALTARAAADAGLRLPRDLDTAGHRHGVDSPEWREAAKVDELLERVVSGLPPDAALVVTADHGQLNVPPEHRFHLEADPRLRKGCTWWRRTSGEVPPPGPRAVEDVLATWRGVLGRCRVGGNPRTGRRGLVRAGRPDHLARVVRSWRCAAGTT